MIEERRKQDRFLDLHNDDVLWANMIRAHQDLLMLDRKEMMDDVLSLGADPHLPGVSIVITL